MSEGDEARRIEEEAEDAEDASIPDVGALALGRKDRDTVLLDAAAGTLSDMDSAIRNIRDWQRERNEHIARLEKEHKDLLDDLDRRSARDGEAEASQGSGSPATDPLYNELLEEIKACESGAGGAGLGAGADDSGSGARTELSEEKLKLLTSASKMSFSVPGKSEAAEEGARAPLDSSAILREADDLLNSLASKEEGILSGTSNDAIAWSSDLQSVLSKLEMLDFPQKTSERMESNPSSRSCTGIKEGEKRREERHIHYTTLHCGAVQHLVRAKTLHPYPANPKIRLEAKVAAR